MKFVIRKMSILLIAVLLLAACSPSDITDDPQNPTEEPNDIVEVDNNVPNTAEPTDQETKDPEPVEDPIEDPVEQPSEEPVEEPVEEPIEEPTVNYQEIIDNYLAEEIVYYEVRNNILYRQKTEKTQPYPLDSELEELTRISDEIVEKTSNAIGCDVADENFKFLLADYKVSYAIYNGKLYRYFYEEDYLEVIYENEKLNYAQFYTNKCVTVSLYSQKWQDFIDRITSLGYKTVTEAYDNDISFYGNISGDIITIDLITGEETLLEGRKDVLGDPYSEIDGDFSGVYTIE